MKYFIMAENFFQENFERGFIMQLPQVVETKGIKVLTTKQIAECYEVTTDLIKKNFSNNRVRFIDGKHYISLTGDDLKQFKNQVKNVHLVDGRASHLYLWTEKGALLHAKSLNTDKAWEVYDYLVDFYFRAKAMPPAAEQKQGLVPVNVEASIMPEELPEKRRRNEPIPEMTDPILIFRTLLHVAENRGLDVKSYPLKCNRSILKRDVIGIQDGLTLREIDYELAWELAHSFIHYDGGDLVRSPLSKDYNEQATRAAGMIIVMLNTLAGLGKKKKA